MIYIDTSSLLKLLLPEPESLAVQRAVAAEEAIVVSSLAALEAEIQLRGAVTGGVITSAQGRRVRERLERVVSAAPFEQAGLSSTLWTTALRRHRADRPRHVRTLDRLHLAAMEELSLARLMTHDASQAAAARALAFVVVMPGRD